MADAVTSNPFGVTDVPNEYRATVLASALKWGVPPSLLAAQINQESGFNPNALSPDGAIGIAQFLASTAKAMGINPRKPHEAIDGMAHLMSNYYKKYGSWDKALIAYHGGPGAVDNPGPNSRDYVAKILGKVGDLTGMVGGAVADTVNPIPNVTKLFDRFVDRDALIRLGKYFLGCLLLTAAAWIVLSRSRVGSMATDAAGKVVKKGVQGRSNPAAKK